MDADIEKMSQDFGLETYAVTQKNAAKEAFHLIKWLRREHVKKEIKSNCDCSLSGFKKLLYIILYGVYELATERVLEKVKLSGQTYVYAYWLSRPAFIAASVKNKNNETVIRCFSRAHGYDLYEQRNELNYLPFREYILHELDGVGFISENGTCIHSKDYQYVDVIDPEIVRTYIEEARQFPGCEIAINKDNMTYMENIGIYQHLVGDYGYRGDLVDDVLGNPEGVCKMSIFHHNCAEDVVGDEFIKRWGKKMNVVVSGKCWVDCANKGANKGSALRHFQEEYGITPDETLAFGDNLNDIEMLKRASHSFAVENARDEVKEAANFVAPSYKEDGVLQVLKAVLSGELC